MNDATPNPNDVNLDSVFAALADERRRHVLHCLQVSEDLMGVADLSEDVAVREHGIPVGEIPAEAVKSIRLSLYHKHIPKLVEAGYVCFDRERGVVSLSEQTGLSQDRLAELLDVGALKE